ICVVFSTRAQCRFIISCITCLDEVESPLHLCRGRLEAWTRDNIGRICGVPQDKNPLRARKQLDYQLKPLRGEFRMMPRYSSHVASRTREGLYEAGGNRDRKSTRLNSSHVS